jgi:hypothetical protein
VRWRTMTTFVTHNRIWQPVHPLRALLLTDFLHVRAGSDTRALRSEL